MTFSQQADKSWAFQSETRLSQAMCHQRKWRFLGITTALMDVSIQKPPPKSEIQFGRMFYGAFPLRG